MPNYNNSIKRTVQNLLFEGINSKRVIGLAGPTPEEYMDILQNHAKEVYMCDYEPSRPYVERTSLIGLYQLKNPSWVDADFCSSIIDNWNDILYIWKELQMSKFKTVYFTFNVSLRNRRSHKYTYDWIKKNVMDFNIVNTQTIKGDGIEYIKKHTTDNPNIMLIEYRSTSYMLSVRLKHEWEIDIPIECKRIILSSFHSINRDKLIKTVYKWYKQGYVISHSADITRNYGLLLHYINLPTKKQYEVGMKKRGNASDVMSNRIIFDLKEFLNKHNHFPRSRIERNLYERVRKLRKNPKYSKIIKELEIKYNCNLPSGILEFKEYVLKYNELPEYNTPLYRCISNFVFRHKNNLNYSDIIELWNKYKIRSKKCLEFKKYVLEHGKLPEYNSDLYIFIRNFVNKHRNDGKYFEIVELWDKYKRRKGHPDLEFKEYVLKYSKLPDYNTKLYVNLQNFMSRNKNNSKYLEVKELYDKYKQLKQ